MKALLLNCSPHQYGCTNKALELAAQGLSETGVHSDIVWCGKRPVTACTLCGFCTRIDGEPRCSSRDILNELLPVLDEYDGLIIGSPVHYASASGIAASLCDRLFRIASDRLAYKPAAAVVSARRAGTTAALDQLNKYFTINNMPIVSSCYWNMVHGSTAEDVLKDEEGVQIMHTLGRNMGWLLNCIEAGKRGGIDVPSAEAKVRTNFIR